MKPVLQRRSQTKKILWVKNYNEIKTAKRAELKVRQTKSPSVMLEAKPVPAHTTYHQKSWAWLSCCMDPLQWNYKLSPLRCRNCWNEGHPLYTLFPSPHIPPGGTHKHAHTNSASFEMQVEAVYAQGLVKRSSSLALLMHAWWWLIYLHT